MNVVIVGAGEVGFHIADRFSREGHDVTIIEQDPGRGADLKSKVNALVVRGSGASLESLEEAQIEGADLFLAVTDQDEVNLISCLLASEQNVSTMVARVKNAEYTGKTWRKNAERLGIDLLINTNTVVADEICNVVSYPAATEVAEFADGQVVFLGYPVKPESPLAGITLRELGDLRGMYRLVVTAIQRGRETLVPRGDDQINEGDVLYFVCRKAELPAVNYLFGFEKRQTKNIFIVGGGLVGASVAKTLAKWKFRVKILDRHLDRCERLAEELDNVVVLHADAIDLHTLKEEGIEEGDVYIAVTEQDETNILCSLLAKSHGVKRSIALVNHPDFVTLAASIGVDVCVSPRLATAGAILKYVRRGEVLRMAMVEQCEAEVAEIGLHEGNPILNRPLHELQVPRGAIVGAVLRGEEVIIPGGDDHFEAGDHVIVFALPDSIVPVEKFFAGP
jgi:trk system potassium uptake protein TrkA